MNNVEFENIGNVEDRIDVAEYIRNVDEEMFANIRDEVFEVLDEMEVDLEDVMDQKSSEEMLSDDTECAISEYEIERVGKFVSSEINTLNARIKHYVIHSYYTTSSALTV